MGKRRPSGDGMVRKRDDGRWEGRIVVGHKANGDPIFRHVYAKTQKALTEKLHQSIECYQDVELTEDSRMTLGEWLDRWLAEYKDGTIRSGTLERSNVDITEELVMLIAAQRNFQANAKAIEGASTLTQTVINMRT